MRVVAVGATMNFFKVGQATLRFLANNHPDIKMRLVIPDTRDAARAIGDLNIELISWNPTDLSSLRPALNDCDSLFMASPIDGRVKTVEKYLSAISRTSISYIACLGIQFTSEQCRMGVAADKVKRLLSDCGIPYDVFDLPMFLENLLYQIPSISQRGQFSFPVSGSATFSYLSSDDLAPIFAERLISDTRVELGSTKWTSHEQISCNQIAKSLSRALGRKISFVRQSRAEFIENITSWGLSREAGEDIAELWELMGSGRDIPATRKLEAILGRPALTFEQWAEKHSCCFDVNPSRPMCRHALPPAGHMY